MIYLSTTRHTQKAYGRIELNLTSFRASSTDGSRSPSESCKHHPTTVSKWM